MIARLRGVTARKEYQSQTVLLDVGGVFYRLACSVNSFDALPPEGEIVTLEVEIRFRDNALFAYGFIDPMECRWFSVLTNIQGVGSKLCMGILSVLTPKKLFEAVMMKDKSAFKQISGVGDRLATRIITELSGRTTLPQQENISETEQPSLEGTEALQQKRDDAVSALANLGFDKQTAFHIVTTLIKEQPDLPLDALIRSGLKALSS